MRFHRVLRGFSVRKMNLPPAQAAEDENLRATVVKQSGCRILGAVMNKIDTSDDKYYSSYYKHYGEYYRRSDEEAQIK